MIGFLTAVAGALLMPLVPVWLGRLSQRGMDRIG